MINTLINKEDKSSADINNLLRKTYYLSKWEKIRTVSVSNRRFLFRQKTDNIDLYRKFSVKNNVEKYVLKNQDDKILSCMDIKIYKDSVYIINLRISSSKFFERIMLITLQAAVEKSLYNTTLKEVYINLADSFFIKNKMKKIILSNGFSALANQSGYEKNLFGEAFVLKVSESPLWNARIKKMNLLINM